MFNQTNNTVNLARMLREIVAAGPSFGKSRKLSGKSYLIEYVSADPQNPINITAARGGVVGDSISNLLEANGATVTREYYINDVVNSLQIRHLARLVHTVLLEIRNEGSRSFTASSDLPKRLAEKLYKRLDGNFGPPESLVPLVEEEMLREQRSDLEQFGIRFDNWFSERNLHESGKVKNVVAKLSELGHTYELGGGIWLRSSNFGDEHDRVLIRDNGEATYIASDAAYHADKFERGFDRLINVWGAQHQAYAKRTIAAIRAMGLDASRLDIVIYQPVWLAAGGPAHAGPAQRSAGLMPLSKVLEEYDVREARYALLRKPLNESVDFDLDLGSADESGVSQLDQVCAALKLADEIVAKSKSIGHVPGDRPYSSETLSFSSATQAIAKLGEYTGIVEYATENYSPNAIIEYIEELAVVFQQYAVNQLENNSKDYGFSPILADVACAAANILRGAFALLGIDCE